MGLPEDFPRRSVIEALAARLAEHPAVERIWLYGSRARGEHLGASDVDIAVVFSPAARVGLWAHWTLWRSAFDVLLEVGLYLQPRALQLGNPMNACYVPPVDQEGMRVPDCCAVEERG